MPPRDLPIAVSVIARSNSSRRECDSALAQPRHDTLLAQSHHHRKEAGRHALAGERHARSVDQRAGLYALFLREGAQQSFVRASVNSFAES